jgi:symplekin
MRHFHLLLCRCTNRANSTPWTTLSSCKARITELVWAPNVHVGIKLSALKFLQRVVLVQTRGVSDPRVSESPRYFELPVDIRQVAKAK